MPCQHGVSSQPLGSCSSSSLSGLLCSNGEQTPFMRLSRSFLLGLGPEEGDVTKMQTDDGSQHLGWERVASPRRGGAVPCVQGGSCSERDPEHTLHSFCLRTIGLFHAVWGGTDLRGTPGLRTCCHPCIPPPRKAAAVAPAAGALPALTKRLQVSLQLGGGWEVLQVLLLTQPSRLHPSASHLWTSGKEMLNATFTFLKCQQFGAKLRRFLGFVVFVLVLWLLALKQVCFAVWVDWSQRLFCYFTS